MVASAVASDIVAVADAAAVGNDDDAAVVRGTNKRWEMGAWQEPQ